MASALLGGGGGGARVADGCRRIGADGDGWVGAKLRAQRPLGSSHGDREMGVWSGGRDVYPCECVCVDCGRMASAGVRWGR